MSGSPGITVPARGLADYRLSMCPQFGGVFTGSLTFTAPGGVVTWYTVEVNVKCMIQGCYDINSVKNIVHKEQKRLFQMACPMALNKL